MTEPQITYMGYPTSLTTEYAEYLNWDRERWLRRISGKGRVVETPLDPDWLKRRKKYRTRFDALIEEGRENGFLDGCMECGIGGVSTHKTETHWEDEE